MGSGEKGNAQALVNRGEENEEVDASFVLKFERMRMYRED